MASSAAPGSPSFDGAWHVINSFQLLIIVALLEIEYPPMVQAFLQSFSFAMFTLPEEVNFVQQSISEEELEGGETSDRFKNYQFNSIYFVV